MSIDWQCSVIWFERGRSRRRWDRWISPSSHSQMSDQLSHSFFRICPFCTLFFDPIFLTVLMLSDNSQIPLLNQGSLCIVQELLCDIHIQTFTWKTTLSSYLASSKLLGNRGDLSLSLPSSPQKFLITPRPAFFTTSFALEETSQSLTA